MDLSIIIINFNTYTLTYNCIASIFESETRISYEVILVDNNSYDQDPTNFQKAFPSIRLIRNHVNQGFGYANNQGMQTAKGRYFLLLNSDTIVYNNTIQKCYDFISSPEAKKNNICAIGCKLLNPDGSYQPSTFPYLKNNLFTFIRTSNPIISFISRALNLDQHKRFNHTITQRVGDISGAFMFIDARIARESRYFDTDFFMFCEDTEWCRERLNKLGTLYYFPEAEIIHYGGQSAPRNKMFSQSQLSQALLWYKKGIGNYIGYICILFTNLISNVFIYPVAKTTNKKNIQQSITSTFKILPYILFEIPKYPRKQNSRKEKLIFIS